MAAACSAPLSSQTASRVRKLWIHFVRRGASPFSPGWEMKYRAHPRGRPATARMIPVYRSSIVREYVVSGRAGPSWSVLLTPSGSLTPSCAWCAPPEAYRLVVRRAWAGLGARRAAPCRRASIVWSGRSGDVWDLGQNGESIN